MQALWCNNVASFEGDHVRFAPSASFPKPWQQPHPPVLLGAPASARTFARVAAHADGWVPMGPNVLFDDTIDDAIDELRSRWTEAGRVSAPRLMAIQAARTPKRLAGAVERADALGVERVVVHVGEAGADESVALLDCLAPALP